MGTLLAMPGELSLNFVDIGGTVADPFPIIRFSMNNPSEATTYDFETEEVSGVCTIKYIYEGSVMRKQEMTDPSVCSPILIMQDVFSPVAYVYPDDTNLSYPGEPQISKSNRQEINYRSDIRLVAIQVDSDGVPISEPNLGGLYRYAVKGNWHFFSNSVICDTVSIFVRRRIKSGVQLNVFNFL